MSYFPKIGIYGVDSPSADAFGRWRTSSPFTLFDSKLIFDSGSLFWDASGSSGATIAYSQSQATVHLQVPATAGARMIRQTKNWFNYQPGKSQLIALTGVVNPQPGIVKRLGYFNDQNGLFWEFSGSSVYVVKRSSTSGTPVDTKYSQSNWNLDKMNGSGSSGVVKDWTKAQIFFMDIEWLGVGRVRMGNYHGGAAIYTHEFPHTNDLDTVYMSTPNLPVRYEIYNQAGTQAGSFAEICTSVMSEGGIDPVGTSIGISSRATSRTITNTATGSLVAIRLKSGYEGKRVELDGISIGTPTETNVTYWTVMFNPSGSGAFTWEDIPNSSLQRATNVSSVNIKRKYDTVVLDDGYLVAGTGQGGDVPSATLNTGISTLLRLGSKINGDRDVIVLGAKPTAASAVYYGSIKVTEIG